jgi:hypothetical protein
VLWDTDLYSALLPELGAAASGFEFLIGLQDPLLGQIVTSLARPGMERLPLWSVMQLHSPPRCSNSRSAGPHPCLSTGQFACSLAIAAKEPTMPSMFNARDADNYERLPRPDGSERGSRDTKRAGIFEGIRQECVENDRLELRGDYRPDGSAWARSGPNARTSIKPITRYPLA